MLLKFFFDHQTTPCTHPDPKTTHRRPQNTLSMCGSRWMALVVVENFQKVRLVFQNPKHEELLTRFIRVIPALPCLLLRRRAPAPSMVLSGPETTYHRPQNSTRRPAAFWRPPQTVFLFSVDVVGWNNCAPSICEDLAKGLTYLGHSIVSLGRHVNASHPPLQSSCSQPIHGVLHPSRPQDDISSSAKQAHAAPRLLEFIPIVVGAPGSDTTYRRPLIALLTLRAVY